MHRNNVHSILVVPNLWIQHAREDLSVAKLEIIPSFIRCYHAQQSMEKMLKTAIAILAGKFVNCGWELSVDGKGLFDNGNKKFRIHDLELLWEYLSSYDKEAFEPLDEIKKTFLKKATEYALICRYPYLLKEVDMQVCFIPDDDVKEVVHASDVIFSDMDNYICSYLGRFSRPYQAKRNRRLSSV